MESMTGFACVKTGRWIWTLRSVNAKGLDVRTRLAVDSLDNDVRAVLRQNFARGTITVALDTDDAAGTLSVNSDFLETLCREALRQAERYPSFHVGDLATLMTVKGVVESGQPKAEEDALKQALKQAAAELKKARLAEGEKLKKCLSEIVDSIEALVKTAETRADAQNEKIRQTLKAQYESLKDAAPLPEERFLQEVTAWMLRADVREELDRLKAHVETARELFGQDGSVGRKLDFLCQEFNREANTLCSKSADIELTQTGLALKSEIDRLREQIQNIE